MGGGLRDSRGKSIVLRCSFSRSIPHLSTSLVFGRGRLGPQSGCAEYLDCGRAGPLLRSTEPVSLHLQSPSIKGLCTYTSSSLLFVPVRSVLLYPTFSLWENQLFLMSSITQIWFREQNNYYCRL